MKPVRVDDYDSERRREQSDAIVLELCERVLTVVQERVIDLHAQGKITPAEGVYIASSTLARTAAIIIGGQLPLQHVDKLPGIVQSYVSMFTSEVETVITTRQIQESEENPKMTQQRGKSVWDA